MSSASYQEGDTAIKQHRLQAPAEREGDINGAIVEMARLDEITLY